MANRPITPCEYARERHHQTAMWRNLWTILLFGFGTAVVVFLILAIYFFIQKAWLPAGLTTLGTIVEGVGIKWVADRRAVAVEEEEKAYEDVKVACEDTTEADNIRAKQTILGRFR